MSEQRIEIFFSSSSTTNEEFFEIPTPKSFETLLVSIDVNNTLKHSGFRDTPKSVSANGVRQIMNKYNQTLLDEIYQPSQKKTNSVFETEAQMWRNQNKQLFMDDDIENEIMDELFEFPSLAKSNELFDLMRRHHLEEMREMTSRARFMMRAMDRVRMQRLVRQLEMRELLENTSNF